MANDSSYNYTASTGKWTKHGPANERFAIGAISDNLKHVSTKALEPLQFIFRAPNGTHEMDHVQAWTEVNGKRKETFFKTITDSDTQAAYMIQMDVLEMSRLVLMKLLSFWPYSSPCV